MTDNTKITRIAVGGIAAAIALAVPFIQQREGHASHPYKDVGGVLTVCYGHTGRDIVVKEYMNSECVKLLDDDVTAATMGTLSVTPKLADKPQILAAAISFSYNVGVRTYAKSSIARDFNSGKFREGCTDMLKYTYAGGKYVKGLALRRQAEYKVCMKGV